MANKKILIAIDGSKTADHAFDWYIENLHTPGFQVIIFHSVEYPEIEINPRMGSKQERLVEKFQKQQEEENILKASYEAKLGEAKVSGQYISKQGKPGEVITRIAQEENADFVVIGSRGHGMVGRAILGSVSTYVLHHAHCPVVIVNKEKK